MTPAKLTAFRNHFSLTLLLISAFCFGYAEINYATDRDRMICVDQLFDTHNALLACDTDRDLFREARQNERAEHLDCEDAVDDLLSADDAACPNPYDFCDDALDHVYDYCMRGQLSPHIEEFYIQQITSCEEGLALQSAEVEHLQQQLRNRDDLQSCLRYIRRIE